VSDENVEILVIADPHDQPGTDQSRFEIAGRFALERQPEYIVCLGDFAEMGSLSKYDVGRVSAEGKRYCDDIASAHKALALFNKPIEKYNNTHIQWKKKTYKPKMIMCAGNHDYARIIRAAAASPSLYGTLKVEDLKYAEYGWDVKKFLEPAIVEGIAFSHYFTSGVMGLPIGGVNHARSLLIKKFSSCVVGHSHLRGFAEEYTVDGRKIMGLVAGCYFDYEMEWTTENDRYWRGLVYLHDVQNGMSEPEFLNLDTYLKPKFG
jgi:predicted phosphodiesterase